MRGRPGCPRCGGSGFVVDPDPERPVVPCECLKSPGADAAGLELPARYRDVTLEAFWKWWKVQHPEERLAQRMGEAMALVGSAMARDALPDGLAGKLEYLLHKCGAQGTPAEPAWKTLRPAQEPEGLSQLQAWAKGGREGVDHWWISGPASSGRSSLAAAALRAWCEASGRTGRFVSVRTLSHRIQDVYHDVISYRNKGFESERDIVEPLMDIPCLVLDDLDLAVSDSRVLRSLGSLLDRRYDEKLPTLLTGRAFVNPERLAGTPLEELVKGQERNPVFRLFLDDPSMVRRLARASGVNLRPALERLLESTQG